MITTNNLAAPADLISFYKNVWEVQNRSTSYLHRQFKNFPKEQLFPSKDEPGIPLVQRVKLPVNPRYVSQLFSLIIDAATQSLGNPHNIDLKYLNQVFELQDVGSILTGDYRMGNLRLLNSRERSVFQCLIELSVRPILRALAKTAENFSFQDWDSNICPVCGREPAFAVKKEEGLELVCTSCFWQWKHRYLQCSRCGTTNHSSLLELIPEGVSGHKVLVCKDCTGYIKIFEEDTAIGKDKQIFDISTVYLDLLAMNYGYKNLIESRLFTSQH